MKEEQFKVLKMMSEATSRMDLNMFAKKVNLSPNQTIQQIQELAKEGFLQKIGNGYGITEKGKVALKVLTPVPEEMGFHFYIGINQPTDLNSQTLEEFYIAIKHVSVVSLEFHLYRGDFELWLKEACKEPELAKEIEGIKGKGLVGEELRAEILKVLNSKYGVLELKIVQNSSILRST